MMNQALITEKRRSRRVRVNIRAAYRSETVTLYGQVGDLSRNGVFLRSDYLDGKGSVVELEILLPGNEIPLTLRGEVVWLDLRPGCSGMGIQFKNVHETARRALANFMIEQAYPVLG